MGALGGSLPGASTPFGAANLAALSAASGGLAVPPYFPVPVPMPYMMPSGIPGGSGGAASVMGYLLPYQQDMYQALFDHLVGGV